MVEQVAYKIHKEFLRGLLTKKEYDTYMDRLADVVLYGLHMPDDFIAALNSIMY